MSDSTLRPPVVTIYPPSRDELQSNKATLVCVASNMSTGFAEVSWTVNGNAVNTGVSTSTAVQQPDNTFQISSSMDMETSDWDKDQVYTCKVSVGSNASEKNIKKSACDTA